RLVGLMTRQEESSPSGMNHAIPSHFVKLLLESRPGRDSVVVHKGYLGVQLNSEVGAKPFLVAKVFENSPAAKARLKENDELIKIDGDAIRGAVDVIRAVGRHKAGDTITVAFSRDGKETSAEVTLSEFPEQPGRVLGVNVVQPSQIVLFNGDKGGDLIQVPLSAIVSPNPTDPNAGGKAQAPVLDVAKERAALRLVPWKELATLRVERSDLNLKLDELKNQVDALKTEVSKLTKVLEQLEQKLNP
ncbi:MAG: protease, Do family, partial [Planctomycetaceae bacterium]|nr:protease, Do family [Planctomycetaceae bacterium]